MKHFILAAAIALAGCAFVEGQTADQKMYGVHADYNVALAAAVQYESLPRCGDPVVPPCSDPRVVDVIRLADNDAHATLVRAEDLVRGTDEDTPDVEFAVKAAQNALDLFQEVLRNHKVME